MSTDVNQTRILAERARIERQVSDRTLCDLLEDNAGRYPDAPAVSWRQGEEWATLSWRELQERVVAAAVVLAGLGVGRGDVVALMMSNRPEHLIADQAAVYLGAIPTTFYSTLAPEQIRYCAAHCAAKVAIVEDRELAERWQALRADLPELEHLVLVSGWNSGSDGFGVAPGVLGRGELHDRAGAGRAL